MNQSIQPADGPAITRVRGGGSARAGWREARSAMLTLYTRLPAEEIR